MSALTALLVLIALATNLQGLIQPAASELEVQLLLETSDSQPWARIRSVGRMATLVCVRGVDYRTKDGGGGGGFMSHACTAEAAFAVVLPNESYVLRLPGTFIFKPDATLSVDITIVTRPFPTRSSSTESSRLVLSWGGTVEEALANFRRLTGIEP